MIQFCTSRSLLNWQRIGVLAALIWIVAAGSARAQVSNFVVAPNYLSATATVIDGASATVVWTATTNTQPKCSAFTPDGRFAYVTGFFGLTKISLADQTTSFVPVGNQNVCIRLTPDGTKAYITDQTANAVYVLDTATDTYGVILVG